MSWSREQLSGLRRLLGLKQVLRRGWTRHPIPSSAVESVADHSYGVALLCLLMCPPELNRSRVLELAVLHDLAEVETGDLTPHDGVGPTEKATLEREALTNLLKTLPNSAYFVTVFEEYQKASTAEARWVKSIDKLEMTLQSLNYEAQHGVDLQEFRDSSGKALENLGLSRERNGLS